MIVRETSTPLAVLGTRNSEIPCASARTRCACSDDEHLGHVAVKHEHLLPSGANPRHCERRAFRHAQVDAWRVRQPQRGNGLALDEPRQPMHLLCLLPA